jgi:hypothetical protein
MIKRMVGSTSISNGIHEFVNDNSNSYRIMVMDAMKINQGYSSEGSCNIFFRQRTKYKWS